MNHAQAYLALSIVRSAANQRSPLNKQAIYGPLFQGFTTENKIPPDIWGQEQKQELANRKQVPSAKG